MISPAAVAGRVEAALNLVQVQKWSFALEETPDFELDLVSYLQA